jgi:hypothetical protein
LPREPCSLTRVLDFAVHRPDLPLYDDAGKVGLGLWNVPVAALALEAAILFGGIFLYLRHRRRTPESPAASFLGFGDLLLAVQSYVFFLFSALI